MGGLRGRAAQAVNNMHLTTPVRWVHDRGRRALLILAYHRVMPLPDPAAYPFDLELISATPENFDFQMGYLRKHFNPVPLSAVVDSFVGGAELPERPVVVTFDDGYDDNLHFAGPILRRHGIVPTIFLSTDYVGTNKPYWFELAVYLMMRLPVGALRMEGIPEALPDADDWVSRRKAGGRLQRTMKDLPKAALQALIERWTGQFRAHINPAEFGLSQVIDWDTVRRMISSGFEFGSHSMSHPVLANLDEATLRDELQGSRERMEKELGRSVRTIAYPVGKEYAYSDLVQRVTAETGYQLGAAYEGGVNWMGEGIRRYALRRQNIERGQDHARFAAMVQFPEWVLW